MAGESECMLLTSEEVFDQKQLLVLHIIGLLAVVLATVDCAVFDGGESDCLHGYQVRHSMAVIIRSVEVS